MNPVEVQRGSGPIVLGLPHTGTHVPTDILQMLTPLGRLLRDTDWHIEKLYDGLLENVTTVRATFHRYVIDANRDPSGASLYPGQNTTGLVPMTDFDGQPLWQVEPTNAEIEERLAAYHQPYHAALSEELDRVRSLHGCVVLYDCHSIRSEIPFLFEGTLPDLNIGTNGGSTCSTTVSQAVADICLNAHGYSTAVNGRFQGGWTTRHYGRPADNMHAIQMELAQKNYLASEEMPFEYDAEKAARLRATLKKILQTLDCVARRLCDYAKYHCENL